ncbi:hypothetical protein C8J57DRAFT_1528349 [Mycena rebaudengoi]|nr:hypothetical protein C8J57DRAFT_1528349 [Mycena rebaudengoi]
MSLAAARDSGSKNITSAGSVTPHGPIIHINDGVDVARTAPPQSSRAQEKGSWLTRIPRQRLEFRSGGHLSSHNPDLRDQDLLLQSCPAVHACFVVIVADDVEDCLIVVSQIRTVVLVVLLSADT